MGFKEPLHLSLGVEPASGIAFEALGDDRRQRLDPLELAAAFGALLIAIADGRVVHPVSAHHAGAHPVCGLFAVLLALVLGDRCEQVLDEDGVRIFAELDGRTFQRRACAEDRLLQIEVVFHVARHAAYVIDDDHGLQRAVLLDEEQHLIKARTRGQRAGHIVVEDLHHLVPAMRRIFPAACLLRGEAIALGGLFLGADAAVDHRRLVALSGHGWSGLLCLSVGDWGSISPSPASGWSRSTRRMLSH